MQYVRVTEILSRLRDFSLINPLVFEEKGKIGTEVHTNIGQHVIKAFTVFDTYPLRNPHTGKILLNPDFTQKWKKRGKGYFESFLKWYELEQPEISHMENEYKDDNLMIVGHIDGLMRTKKENFNTLIDFKCSYKSDMEMWGMQSHFYKHLLELNGISVADKLLWIQLDKDGHMPKLIYIPYSQETMQKCFHEVNKYWNEKKDAKEI